MREHLYLLNRRSAVLILVIGIALGIMGGYILILQDRVSQQEQRLTRQAERLQDLETENHRSDLLADEYLDWARILEGRLNGFLEEDQAEFFQENSRLLRHFAENNLTIDYYGYGDSMLRPPYTYVVQMQEIYDPRAISFHNTDGGGKSSCWGLESLDRHYTRNMRNFIFMFNNDMFMNLTTEDTVRCYAGIYDYVAANGTRPIPILPVLRHCTMAAITFDQGIPVFQNGSVACDRGFQVSYVREVEERLAERGIHAVPLYDALDSNPGNGESDHYDDIYYYDGVHPTPLGHRVMADFLWKFLSRGDGQTSPG